MATSGQKNQQIPHPVQLPHRRHLVAACFAS
jgi:hypothetical protein